MFDVVQGDVPGRFRQIRSQAHWSCRRDAVPDPQWQSENELKGLLREFVNGLDPETQRIFLRRYWYNHSIKELAKAMHCSENRITGILFRTRKKLRNFLEKEGYRV